MARPLLRTFLGWIEVLTPAFTKPGYANALVVMAGWTQTTGPHAVTQALVETKVAGRRHHEVFHRFFSRHLETRRGRSKKECRSNRQGSYKKRTELAREMLDVMQQWRPEARFRVSCDCAYANATVLRDLPINIDMVGAMRPDAVLTALPTEAERQKTGRRRKKGAVLPKPLAPSKSAKQRWKKIKVHIYGRDVIQEIKTIDAQWYRGAGTQLLRIVVVRVPHGKVPIRVYFSTDLNMTIEEILETYAGRWSTEVCFRDLKLLLGFGDSKARTKNAVERTATFVGYTYTLVMLWFSRQGVCRSPFATPPLRTTADPTSATPDVGGGRRWRRAQFRLY